MTLRCCIVAFLITPCLHAHADTLPDFVFHQVLPSEGKAFAEITGIVQDRQGYLWLSTFNGLFRYDGYVMTQYRNNPMDANSPRSNLMVTIAIDSAGLIWIGTLNNGIEQFNPAIGRFKHFGHDNKDGGSISGDSIVTILTDHNGVVWVGTRNGLDRYEAHTKNFIHYKYQQGNNTTIGSDLITVLFEDKEGVLWVGTKKSRGHLSPGGLNRFNRASQTFTRFLNEANDGFSLASNNIEAICETRSGMLWIGTAGNFVHQMDRIKGTFTRISGLDDITDNIIRTEDRIKYFSPISFIHEDRAGGMWIGFIAGGLSYYHPATEKFLHYASLTNLPEKYNDRNARACYTSRDGVLWISSRSGNLYRIDPVKKTIPFYPSPKHVNGFYEDSDGTIWIGKEHGGLIHYDKNGNIIEQFKHDEQHPASLSDDRIRGIKTDPDGHLWLGTGGGGLEMFDRARKKFIHYPYVPGNKNSLSSGTVLSIALDNKKNIWIGTLYGLNRLNPATGVITQFHFYPENKEEWNQNSISSVAEDRENKIWAGCMGGGGVQMIDPETGKFTTYLKGLTIESILIDHSGILWVGGFEGIFYYDRKQDRFIQFADRFSSKEIINIIALAEDDQENIWAVATNRLIRISAHRNEVYSYGHEFGLSSFMNKWNYKTRDGTVYFTDLRGYYKFKPDQLWTERKPPQIIISPIKLRNHGDLLNDNVIDNQIVLQHDQHTFSFEFAVIDFSDPASNLHLFMLENYDREWNYPGSDHRAIYFNVPPGHYIFKVRGMNGFGLVAEKHIEIEIKPAWWTAWWFRIAVLAAGVVLIYSMLRWRLKQQFSLRMERAEKEKILADLKQQTTELQMQALRAQMNPHFIFNSLNSINSFILDNDKEKASEYLTKFSRLVRLILHHSQSATIPLENEVEALTLYLELERVRYDEHFDFTIKIESALNISALKVPPLIIQPYAENAIWHGLMQKEEKGHLTIELYHENDLLICRITDDGIGRKKAGELKSKNAVTHKSMGMQITADRIAILQTKNAQELAVHLTDLVMPDGAAGGTQVELQIPLQYD